MVVFHNEGADRTVVSLQQIAQPAVDHIAHLDGSLVAAAGEEALVVVEAPDLILGVRLLHNVLLPVLDGAVLSAIRCVGVLVSPVRQRVSEQKASART